MRREYDTEALQDHRKVEQAEKQGISIINPLSMFYKRVQIFIQNEKRNEKISGV